MQEPMGSRFGGRNWADVVENRRKDEEMVLEEDGGDEVAKGWNEIMKRCEELRFPADEQVEIYIVLVCSAFRAIGNAELENVLEAVNQNIKNIDCYEEIEMVKKFVYGDMIMLKAKDMNVTQKFEHLQVFQFQGEEVIVYKPVRIRVYNAIVSMDFPRSGIPIVKDMLGKYAYIVYTNPLTHGTEKMKAMLSGKFRMGLKMKMGKMSEEIPQLIKLKEQNIRIHIVGQIRRCYRCQQNGHIAKECPNIHQIGEMRITGNEGENRKNIEGIENRSNKNQKVEQMKQKIVGNEGLPLDVGREEVVMTQNEENLEEIQPEIGNLSEQKGAGNSQDVGDEVLSTQIRNETLKEYIGESQVAKSTTEECKLTLENTEKQYNSGKTKKECKIKSTEKKIDGKVGTDSHQAKRVKKN